MRLRQRGTHVRRHIVRTFGRVDEQRIAIRNQSGKETFEVGDHVGIVVLVDQQAGGGVLDVEREHAGGHVALPRPGRHLLGDVIDAAAAGIDMDLADKLAHGDLGLFKLILIVCQCIDFFLQAGHAALAEARLLPKDIRGMHGFLGLVVSVLLGVSGRMKKAANEINVVMSEENRERYYGKDTTLETEVGNKAAEGGAIGAAVGSSVGAIAAAIAAAGTVLVLPGLGLVVAGPLAAAVAGAGAGGVTAGIVGALIGWGIPEDRLEEYETGLGGVEY